MKILYIAFEAPSKFYGGGMGLIQSISSLSAFARIDYIGLEFDEALFPQFNTDKKYFIKKKKNPFACAKNLLLGLPTFYYGSWKKIMKVINPRDYDLVFTDFSHHDFVAEWAVRHNLKVITRVHNIESDMSYGVRRSKKLTHYKIRAIINGGSIERREARSMRLSDRLLFLTENDLDRAANLYGSFVREKSDIVPVCLERVTDQSLPSPVEGQYILATGTLSHGANADGIVWFIENVWRKFEEKGEYPALKLVVAGSHPDEGVKRVCANAKNCVLIDTPADMSPYFSHAKFYVAPIFSGAGMKVKVAEAFFYGLNVLGSSHALIGYENAEEFYFRADGVEDFLLGLNKFAAGKVAPAQACKEMAEREYSLSGSAAKFENCARRSADC